MINHDPRQVAPPRPARRWTRAAGAGLVTLAASLFITTAGVEAAPTQSADARTDSQFTHGTVATSAGNLHYVRTGSGPVIVLLHGWPQTWWEWNTVMPALATNHTVVAFDLPGLGTSAIPGNGYDKATTAARIREGVRALGYTQPIGIIGHDLGAIVAYNYARDFPTEVRRIAALESPLPGFGLEDLYGLSFHFTFNASPAPIPETILDTNDVPTYLGMIFDFSFQSETIDRPRYYLAYSDSARRTAGYGYYRAFAQDAADNQAQAAAKRLTQPVLGMGGQYSFGPGVAASFSQVANDVRTAVAPDAAHFIPEENPTYLADCAKLFFGPTGVAPSRPELASCVA